MLLGKKIKDKIKCMLEEYEDSNTPIKELCSKYQLSDRYIYKAIKDGIIKNRKDRHTPQYERIIKNEELMYYLLGLISSDGNMSKRNRIEISLHSRDYELLTILSIGIYGIDRVLKDSKRVRARLIIYGKDVYNLYESFGLTQRKSATLNIDFDKIPKKFFIDFLRGYIDGDGNYLFKNINNVRLRMNGNQNTMSQFKEYILKYYDIPTSVYKTNTKSSFPYYLWVLQRNELVKRMLVLLYENKTYYMERKYNIIKEVFSAV